MEKIAVTEAELKKYLSRGAKIWGYIIISIVSVVVFCVSIDFINSVNEYLKLLILIVYGSGICYSVTKVSKISILSKKKMDKLVAIRGIVTGIEEISTRRNNRTYICELLIKERYNFDSEKMTYVTNEERTKVQMDSKIYLGLPSSAERRVSLNDEIAFAGGKLVTDVKYINPIKREYRIQNKAKKITNPRKPLDIPAKYYSIIELNQGNKIENTYYGEIAFARARGNIKDEIVIWDFTIMIRERYYMKTNEQYDEYKAKYIGQFPIDNRSKHKCSVFYDVDKYYMYEGYEGSLDAFNIGDKVAIITDKKRKKLKYIETI